MVIRFAQQHGKVTRKDVIELCRLSDYQAGNLLRRLSNEAKLILHGKSRGAYYTIPANK